MLTKALKTRLQKLIDTVPNKDFVEFWAEFAAHSKKKEHLIIAQFKIGDEVEWEHADEIISGTINKIYHSACAITQNDGLSTRWRVSAGCLVKSQVIKIR
jgi:uncharacterized protein (DUF2147 family)